MNVNCLFYVLAPGQRSSASVSRRESPGACSSLAGHDVHELHLRFQPHSSEAPLSWLRKSESHANKLVILLLLLIIRMGQIVLYSHRCAAYLCFDTDCLPELLQEQIPTEIYERPHGQSVWSLLQWAEKERWDSSILINVTVSLLSRPQLLVLLFFLQPVGAVWWARRWLNSVSLFNFQDVLCAHKIERGKCWVHIIWNSCFMSFAPLFFFQFI